MDAMSVESHRKTAHAQKMVWSQKEITPDENNVEKEQLEVPGSGKTQARDLENKES